MSAYKLTAGQDLSVTLLEDKFMENINILKYENQNDCTGESRQHLVTCSACNTDTYYNK